MFSELLCCRIPNLQLTDNEEGRVDIELSDDPYDYFELDVDSCPLLITCSKVCVINAAKLSMRQLCNNYTTETAVESDRLVLLYLLYFVLLK